MCQFSCRNIECIWKHFTISEHNFPCYCDGKTLKDAWLFYKNVHNVENNVDVYKNAESMQESRSSGEGLENGRVLV